MPGKRGKQSVKKGLPLGLLASIGAPILGETAKPIFGKIFGKSLKRKKRIRYH